jgi:hypothetical protein
VDKKSYAKVLETVGMNAPLLTIKIDEEEEEPDFQIMPFQQRRFPMDRCGMCMIFMNALLILFILIFIIWYVVTHSK